MARKKILFIGGSLNQSQIAYAISRELCDEYDCWFTAYFIDGFLGWLVPRTGWADRSPLAGPHRQHTEDFFVEKGLQVDYKGQKNHYDLVISMQDIIIGSSIRKKKYKMLLVQEGMTDPENWTYHLVRTIGLPRWMGSTSMTGLSHVYEKFCVASEGYRDHFIRIGVKPERILVTGIPNFDNLERYKGPTSFPYQNYVLVATSDARETAKGDNRKKFIEKCVRIAAGRQLIFKFHPNEIFERAIKEVEMYAPGALVFTSGDVYPMIGNCDVLICQYSSVAFIGLALGKEVHSYFDVNYLRKVLPMQNGGTSQKAIAAQARLMLERV